MNILEFEVAERLLLGAQFRKQEVEFYKNDSTEIWNLENAIIFTTVEFQLHFKAVAYLCAQMHKLQNPFDKLILIHSVLHLKFYISQITYVTRREQVVSIHFKSTKTN